MVAEELQTIQTVGRRKTAVARVLLRQGEGEWTINGRPMAEYFPRKAHQIRVEEPLQATELDGRFDIQIRVRCGGLTGQADAIRMGVSRAQVAFDEEQRSTLRSRGLLTRDPRKEERKKPGRPQARKRIQFSKR